MKKLALLLLVLVALSWAGTYTQTQFEERTGASGLEIAKYWQLLAVMALVVSAILVAIAYLVGIGLEMPEMRAWAGNELVQIVTNAIIILVLIAAIGFIDAIVMAIVASSGVPVVCVPGQSCLQNVTDAYLADYVNLAKDGARDVLGNNVDAASLASMRFGIYCTTYYCAQLGISYTVAAGYILDQDMYSILFEYYGNILSSMEAQKFFVDQISFRMGPVLLAVGLVARSFFITRKLGGLLIAIAVGIMFFLPGMYVFDWMTLDMTTNADKIMDARTSSCPVECATAAPLAFIEGGAGLTSPPDVYDSFSFDQADIAQGIINGTISSATGSNGSAIGRTVVSCSADADFNECPAACRELPYPPISMCLNSTNRTQQNCSLVPSECKVRRLVDTTPPPTGTFDTAAYAQCPASCKVVPPLKSNCSIGRCLDSRFDCRVAKRTDLEWRPAAPDAGHAAECNYARDCPANLTATESCTYVVPETGRCNDLCPDCPAYCRLDGADTEHMPADCWVNETNHTLKAACQACVDTCKVSVPAIEALSPPPGNCSACWPERRLFYSPLPEAYIADNASDPAGGICSMVSCPSAYRASLPRSTCESCLFTEESYGYDPPINTQCQDVCAPSADVPAKAPGEYTKIGADGMVGKPEIQAVAKLLIPGYLLPLFNIVATLMFIRGLSVLLGGDIEIPGLAKVF